MKVYLVVGRARPLTRSEEFPDRQPLGRVDMLTFTFRVALLLHGCDDALPESSVKVTVEALIKVRVVIKVRVEALVDCTVPDADEPPEKLVSVTQLCICCSKCN